MELSTFGALLTFAIELEEHASRFYHEAGDNRECASLRETFFALARQSDSRRKLLAATRQEHVTEMLLEPITELRRDAYTVESNSLAGMTCAQVLAHAVEMERKAQAFYADAALRARHLLAGVARIFERLARDRQKRAQELACLLQV